jgi:hypothetical protein
MLGLVCRVVLVVAPVALFTGHAASAAGPVQASGPFSPSLHMGVNGRYYEDVCDHAKPFFCLAERVLPLDFDPSTYVRGMRSASRPLAEQPPTGTGLPSDFTAAYHITSAMQDSGGLVTLVDLPDSHALADANAYRAQFSIPSFATCTFPITGASPCLITVDENGARMNQNVGDDVSGGDSETALDLDMISAVCPKCSILLVQMTRAEGDSSCGTAPCVNDEDFLTSIASASSVAGSALGSISISFGSCEARSAGWDASSQDPPGPYTANGHLVVAASGDQGYLLTEGLACFSPAYPASVDTVLAVGGTSMVSGGSESAWRSAGSGCSTEFAMPPYQTAYATAHPGAFSRCSKRDTADVSAVADFNNGLGVAMYDSTWGGWGGVQGTSAASPMFAAILTMTGIVAQVATDFGYLYTHPGFFNDITTGGNGLCSDNQCSAGPGWDGPTGLGSPNATAMAMAGSSSGGSSRSSSGSSSDSSSDSSSGSSSGGIVDASLGDSGGADAASDGGSGSTGNSSGCGCGAVRTDAAANGFALFALAVCLTVIARQRRR